MLHGAIINFRRRIVNRTRGFSCRAAAQFNPGVRGATVGLRWVYGAAMVGERRGNGGGLENTRVRCSFLITWVPWLVALLGTGQAKKAPGRWIRMIWNAGGIRWETRRRNRP